MKTRFQNPPINELIIATYFEPLIAELRSEHIGLFWARIRNDFPKVEQQGPVGSIEAFQVTGNEFVPIPRYWFISEDEVNLIQVQRNAFMLNWRRRNEEYPHFADHLKPTFDKYFQVFEDFLREDVGVGDPGIDLCELTYVNTIESCQYWQGPQDTANVIPSFAFLKTGMDPASALNCAYTYTPDSNLTVRVGIRNGQSTRKPDTPVLVFEIRATARLGKVGKSVADSWYERAHRAIIACFLQMTSKDIQDAYWQPRGGE